MEIKRLLNISFYPKYSKWIFILLIVGISFIYSFQKILFFPPQSVHQWRQCDCLSYTKNYYEEGMKFFQPSLHCQLSEGGESGTTISEFPVIYFSVAVFWKIFGEHEFIFRLVNLLLAFIALFCIYKTLEDFFLDSFWGIVIPLLLFTSPIFSYYAINFLPNVPAFSFALIGWYYFYRFYKNERNRLLYLSMFFFLLGGLLKITSAISFVVLCGIFLLEILNIYRFRGNEKIFKRPLKQVIPFCIVILCLFFWYLYVNYFNKVHEVNIFLTGIWPIWKVSPEQIRQTWENVRVLWLNSYFSKPVLMLSAFLFVMLVILFRKIKRFFLISTILFFIGSILFILLWFYAIKDHDYYVINLLILIVFVLVSAFVFLKDNFSAVFKSVYFKLIFFIFLAYNIYYCSGQIHERYWGGWNTNWGKSEKFNKQDLVTIRPYLEKLGIKRNTKVISIPDPSCNISLYLMDLKGWTSYANDNNDSLKIAEKIRLGAEYLIINDSTIYNEKYLKPFLQNKIGSYKEVDIYSIGE